MYRKLSLHFPYLVIVQYLNTCSKYIYQSGEIAKSLQNSWDLYLRKNVNIKLREKQRKV
jgi:hypothetical protein